MIRTHAQSDQQHSFTYSLCDAVTGKRCDFYFSYSNGDTCAEKRNFVWKL